LAQRTKKGCISLLQWIANGPSLVGVELTVNLLLGRPTRLDSVLGWRMSDAELTAEIRLK
jgi:hypothetical protein